MSSGRLSDLQERIRSAPDRKQARLVAETIAKEARARALKAEALGVFIYLASEAEIEKRIAELVDGLSKTSAAIPPLWGIPVAVKDNIDVAGMPTSAACPGYAYTPARDSEVVARLKAAGAVILGKTNMDQFATGLVGTRSPHPIPLNAFDPAVVPGGSSSGSACAVARGIVPLALGTDTAGSGRVPAALQNLWGFKPSVGSWSIEGVVPACKSIDCVTVFAHRAEDAALVHAIVAHTQEKTVTAEHSPPFGASPGTGTGGAPGNVARLRIAIPEASQLWFDDNQESAALFGRVRAAWQNLPGVEVVAIDPAPFLEAAKMLYDGPWVSERWAQYGEFIEANPDAVVAVTKKVIEGGKSRLASDGWKAIYRMNDIKNRIYADNADIDAFVFPTIPRPYTRAEVDADPIGINSRLGTYTNFMNLLDFCAVAFPFGAYSSGFPHGATLFAPAGKDSRILELAARFWKHSQNTSARGQLIAVCGAHMSGLTLNHQLVELGGVFVSAETTAETYRMLLMSGGKRPGLVSAEPGKGKSFPLEVWDLPNESVGALLAKIAAPLGLGTVELKDGRGVKGFVCYDSQAAERDISEFGGWRGFLNSKT